MNDLDFGLFAGHVTVGTDKRNEDHPDGVEMTMKRTETTMTENRRGTIVVDEFLEKHGAVLPAHIIDFALDVRTIFVEMEDALDDRSPVGV